MKIFQAYPTKKAGNEIIFRFEDETSANQFLATYQLFKQTLVEIQVTDDREISSKQRKFIYALFRDISNWSGDMPEYVKQMFKMWFEQWKDLDEFSLRDVEKSVAAELITFMLDFVAEHDVPLSFKPLDALEPDEIKHWEYKALIEGFDVIDGSRPVELAHGEHAVGMGRDRNAISNVGNTVFSLSHAHHMELHSVGLSEFKSKYHINGVLVTPEILKELEIRGRKFGKS
ncbi:hypothetical protein LKI_01910 [Leuconostoc kimchii IMSNU 11154]|uniref:Uncharacterized protein n=1 Tax=Leuconostoc kimchii (strain IMSNU 11154 / KCTC 2386 / IH25) TaxID=762051 RepID=D5T0X6_LEUKI|nr:putative HNHc nuclease [Leuconostoc kimchii]ADG39925.1 hypothetical protein LKI_01910 [Leuconostoc kimchii IMSNU 11154]